MKITQPKTNPKVLTQLTSLLKSPTSTDKLDAFLKKSKKYSLGPDAMELFIKYDYISLATSYTEKFYGIDAAMTRRLIKSRQLLGNFSSHSFVDLPKTMLDQIINLTGGLSVARVNLANFIAKDQEAVMTKLVAKFKDDILLSISEQLDSINGLTNKMALKIMKYLPPKYDKYLAVVCENLNNYPLLNKKQFQKDLDKNGFTRLTKKYSKQFDL